MDNQSVIDYNNECTNAVKIRGASTPISEAFLKGDLHMKGILLAGGAGTRLYPLTLVTSKQLLPVYNKPMIYYPLSTLMLARIRDVLIISTPIDIPRIRELFGDGEALGMHISYAVQERPEGLAQAFTIGRDFIGDDSCAMILGDNIFYGNGLYHKLSLAAENASNGSATIFGYYVEDPRRFGVMELEKGIGGKEKQVRVLSVEEKPAHPKSNYAVVGLYFYPPGVSGMADQVQPSARGELEITYTLMDYLSYFGDNRDYFDEKTLALALAIADYLGVSVEWLLTGREREGLTEEERRLVDGWRQLDARDRDDVLGIVEGKLERSMPRSRAETPRSAG